jgi:hypothetical protein
VGIWKNGSTTTSPDNSKAGETDEDETEEVDVDEEEDEESEAEGEEEGAIEADVHTISAKLNNTTCPPSVTPPNTRRCASMNGEN